MSALRPALPALILLLAFASGPAKAGAIPDLVLVDSDPMGPKVVGHVVALTRDSENLDELVSVTVASPLPAGQGIAIFRWSSSAQGGFARQGDRVWFDGPNCTGTAYIRAEYGLPGIFNAAVLRETTTGGLEPWIATSLTIETPSLNSRLNQVGACAGVMPAVEFDAVPAAIITDPAGTPINDIHVLFIRPFEVVAVPSP